MYKLPESVCILGYVYKVVACESMLDVDPIGRTAMLGSINPYDKIINIFVHERDDFDLQQVLLHEVLHGIALELHLAIDEETNDTLATVILDTFTRNGLFK